MDNKEFNLACAEYLGILDKEMLHPNSISIFVIHNDCANSQEFDAVYNMNDLALVIEKMKLNVVMLANHWTASENDTINDDDFNHSLDKDRTKAIHKCICSVLGIDYE